MLYFSSRLNAHPYKPAADRLFAALDLFNIEYKFINNTKDIWLRDFMPVRTRSGKLVSFRYEPSYLDDSPKLKTYFKTDLSAELSLPDIEYSDINLDGGNVVFSPSKKKAIISNRVITENPQRSKACTVYEIFKVLEVEATDGVIIPSLNSDMTGHADGMVRFVDENTVLVNEPKSKNDFESRVINQLNRNGLTVITMPYFETKHKAADGTKSAEGCYLNYLETEKVVFFPVFSANHETDTKAISIAEKALGKQVIPLNVNKIALHGGLLNCISWEI